MSKYKIGDKVRVRAVLANFAYDNIGGYYATSDMCKYAGEIAKVIALYTFVDGHSTYLLDTLDETPVGAPRRYYWNDDMLEPVDEDSGTVINETNAKKIAKTMLDLGKNLVISSNNDKKIILPKEVGEELDIAKNELQISFDVYIGNVFDSVISDKASYHYYLNNTNAIIKLADAWRYGWEVEKESKYLVWVKLPDTGAQFYKERLNGQPRWERRDKTDLLEASWYQFTKSEVEQLKSDYPYIKIKEVEE